MWRLNARLRLRIVSFLLLSAFSQSQIRFHRFVIALLDLLLLMIIAMRSKGFRFGICAFEIEM